MKTIFWLSFILIFSLGLLMIFSTTSAEVLDHDLSKSHTQFMVKQAFYSLAGLFLGWIAFKTGFKRFISFSPYLLALFTFFLVLVLLPGVGREVNGSKRWISLGGFSFQPSEFVKYILPACFIYIFMQSKESFFTFSSFLKKIIPLAIPLFLILIEPNNGTVFVMGTSLIVLLFLTKVPFKFFAWPLLSTILFLGVFAFQLPYVKARFEVYLHPELDLKGKGHQPYQAKIAAGSGGFYGKGPGKSFQKLSYLPEAQNDYIAAIYAEEFGFLGIVVLVFLYMGITLFGFYIALKSFSEEGFYLASVITFLIAFQAFLNLGVVSGLLPSTGLNLPLFSQGGTSLMANMVGLSLLLSIDSYNKKINNIKNSASIN